jgi:hypothetical protein
VSAALPRALAQQYCGRDDANAQLQRSATIRVLRPPEDVAALAEGDVVVVTALTPSARAGGGVLELQVQQGAGLRLELVPCDAMRCTQLPLRSPVPPTAAATTPASHPHPLPQAGKHTQWQLLGRAAALAPEFASAYAPRRALQLGGLASAQLAPQQDFDFTGLVLHVGPRVQAERGGLSQWVFLADGSVAGGGEAGGQAGQQPYLLAVRLQGQAECVDFLEPSRALGSVLSLRNLVLENRDEPNRLWAAVAGDTAAVATVAAPGGGAGRRQAPQEGLLGWARANAALVQQLQRRILELVGP